MSESHDQTDCPIEQDRQNESFVLDGAYVREQAADAARLFLTPIFVIYRILAGRNANGRITVQPDV